MLGSEFLRFLLRECRTGHRKSLLYLFVDDALRFLYLFGRHLGAVREVYAQTLLCDVAPALLYGRSENDLQCLQEQGVSRVQTGGLFGLVGQGTLQIML